MMITSVDWKRDGLAAGSRIVDDDWNDWNSPVMSLDNAKLFLKRTWCGDADVNEYGNRNGGDIRTKFDIAVLNKTRRLSSCADRSMLCTPDSLVSDLPRDRSSSYYLQNQAPRLGCHRSE